MATNMKTILFLTMASYMWDQREAKILRNNALMNRMVSNFHRDNRENVVMKINNNKNTNSLEWQELKQQDKEVRAQDREDALEKETESRRRHERNERVVYEEPQKERYSRSRNLESRHQQRSEQQNERRNERQSERQNERHSERRNGRQSELQSERQRERQSQLEEQYYSIQHKDKPVRQSAEKSHRDRSEPQDYTERPKPNSRLIEAMKNILCKHFPSIPCYLIINDASLSGLIDKSIRQINHKKTMTSTNAPLSYEKKHVKMFTTVNSEDLSSFLQVRAPTVMYKNNRTPRDSYLQEYVHKTKAAEIREKQMKQQESSQRNKEPANNVQGEDAAKTYNDKNVYYKGRKKLRKFYPHKYKDNSPHLENYESHEDRISLEAPEQGADMRTKRKHLKLNEDESPGVWRIDYMKHGEPSLTKINYGMTAEEPFKADMSKTIDKNLINDNHIDQTIRRDILHPDLYIKTNMGRKNR